MIKTKYLVRSNVDDNNIFTDFDSKEAAIKYAEGFPVEDEVYVVEVLFDTDPDADEPREELDSEVIWTAEENLISKDPFDLSWDEPKEYGEYDDDVRKMREMLEEKENLVECQECFELFPKEDCIKIEIGYVCPTCGKLLTRKAELAKDMIDPATFDLDFPQVSDYDEDEDDEYYVEPEVQPEAEIPLEQPIVAEPDVAAEFENTPVSYAGEPMGEDSSDDDSSDALAEDYTGTPELRTTHLEYVDGNPTDGKAVLPDNITKKEDEHCKKYVVINHDAYEKALKEGIIINPLTEAVKAKYYYSCDPSGIEGEVYATGTDDAYHQVEDYLASKGIYVADEIIVVEKADTLTEGPKDFFKKIGNKIGDKFAEIGGGTEKNIAKFANSKWQGKFSVKARDEKGQVAEEKKFNKWEDADGYAKQWSANSKHGPASIFADGKVVRSYEDGKVDINDIKDMSKETAVQNRQDKRDADADKQADKYARKAIQDEKPEEKKEEPKEEPKLDPRWQDDKKTTDSDITTDAVQPADDKTNYTIDNKEEEKPTEVQAEKEEPKEEPKAEPEKSAEEKPEEKPAEETKSEEKPAEEEKPVEEPKAEEQPAEETKPEEEQPAEETPVAKRDMSKQNKAKEGNKKIFDAFKAAGLDTSKLYVEKTDKRGRKYKAASPELLQIRKALLGEDYNPAEEEVLEEAAAKTPFDSEEKVGTKVKIIHLEGEDNRYDGAVGTITDIDSIGQLHGTWGGLAIIPGVDEYEVLEESLNNSEKTSEHESENESEKLTLNETAEHEKVLAFAKELLNSDVEESLEETVPQDLSDNRTPVPQESGELGEPLDGTEMRKHEKAIQEHVNDPRPLISCEQELHGMDNAVVDCETDMKVIAHSEDEKPLACKTYKEELFGNPMVEASSAETKAFKHGGKDLADYIRGKAIARIKDPKARDAAIAAAKAGRDDVVKQFTGDRKEDQAFTAYEKKAQAMSDAGVKDDSDGYLTTDALRLD